MARMVFLNIGWMERYQGLEDDSIVGGGAYVNENEEGCEIFNFKPYKGHMYGFARINGSINITRLGASRKEDIIKNVMVVWVATSPIHGSVIVGWYKNATVYRHHQHAPEGSGQARPGKREWGYRVKAQAEDCTLLPVDQRTCQIPRGKGGMGQSNVWYAEERGHFRRKVLEYIAQN